MNDKVDVGKLIGVDARVGVSVGITIQTGKFAFVKPSVSIECTTPGDMTPDELYDFLTEWALDKLGALEDKLIEYAG